MSSLIDGLEIKEKKLRKNWLRLSIFESFIFPTLNFIVLIVMSTILFSKISLLLHNAINISNILYIILVFFIIFLIILAIKGLIFWSIYHCAYKKHGTALLLFFLIVTPLLFFHKLSEIFFALIFKSVFVQKILSLEEINEYASALYPLVNSTLNFFIISLFCSSALTVWWFVWSIKLRKVNKKLQTLTNPPVPTETVSNLT